MSVLIAVCIFLAVMLIGALVNSAKSRSEMGREVERLRWDLSNLKESLDCKACRGEGTIDAKCGACNGTGRLP